MKLFPVVIKSYHKVNVVNKFRYTIFKYIPQQPDQFFFSKFQSYHIKYFVRTKFSGKFLYFSYLSFFCYFEAISMKHLTGHKKRRQERKKKKKPKVSTFVTQNELKKKAELMDGTQQHFRSDVHGTGIVNRLRDSIQSVSCFNFFFFPLLCLTPSTISGHE